MKVKAAKLHWEKGYAIVVDGVFKKYKFVPLCFTPLKKEKTRVGFHGVATFVYGSKRKYRGSGVRMIFSEVLELETLNPQWVKDNHFAGLI